MVAVALALLCVAGCAPAASPLTLKGLPPPVPFPFGVASTDGRLAFMRMPQAGIRALVLADGAELWTSSDAHTPLFADRTGLIATVPAVDRRHVVQIGLFDVDTGARKFVSDPIVLPEWALVTGGSDVEVRFRAAPANGMLLLDWCARSWYGGGANPDPRIERGASRQDSGHVRIDVADGHVTAGNTLVSDLSCADRQETKAAAAPPEAIASTQIGERLYYLVALAPTQRTAARARLTAADAATGAIHWQRELAVPTQQRKLPLEIRKGGY